jgi:hypothetical protein
VKNHSQAEPLRKLDGFIFTIVVDEQHFIDNFDGNLLDRSFESASCIPGWEDDGDSLIVEHGNQDGH